MTLNGADSAICISFFPVQQRHKAFRDYNGMVLPMVLGPNYLISRRTKNSPALYNADLGRLGFESHQLAHGTIGPLKIALDAIVRLRSCYHRRHNDSDGKYYVRDDENGLLQLEEELILTITSNRSLPSSYFAYFLEDEEERVLCGSRPQDEELSEFTADRVVNIRDTNYRDRPLHEAGILSVHDLNGFFDIVDANKKRRGLKLKLAMDMTCIPTALTLSAKVTAQFRDQRFRNLVKVSMRALYEVKYMEFLRAVALCQVILYTFEYNGVTIEELATVAPTHWNDSWCHSNLFSWCHIVEMTLTWMSRIIHDAARRVLDEQREVAAFVDEAPQSCRLKPRCHSLDRKPLVYPKKAVSKIVVGTVTITVTEPDDGDECVDEAEESPLSAADLDESEQERDGDARDEDADKVDCS